MKKILALLLCGLILCGCTPAGTPSEPVTPTTPAVTDPVTEPETEPVTEPAADSVSVTIYYGNDNADGFETAEFTVEEVNMNVLVEKLIEVGVLNDQIYIGSMQVDGDHLILNFGPGFGDLINSMGTAGEYIIMGSVVNTFLTAFDAGTVSVRVGGQILESGHIVYDEPMGFFQ